jgi:rod shape-determining protein MreD
MRLRAFLAIFILFFLEISTQNILSDQAPALVLIGVVFFALTDGPVAGFALGAWAGFLFDLLGTGKLGYEMVLFSAMGAACGYLSNVLFRDGFWTQMFLPAGLNILIQLFNLIWFRRLSGRPINWFVLKEAWDVSSLFLTAFSSPVIFFFLKQTVRRRRPARPKVPAQAFK